MRRLKEVRTAIKDLNLTKVAKASKVCYDKVWRLVNNPKSAPSCKTVEALSDWLDRSRRVIKKFKKGA